MSLDLINIKNDIRKLDFKVQWIINELKRLERNINKSSNNTIVNTDTNTNTTIVQTVDNELEPKIVSTTTYTILNTDINKMLLFTNVLGCVVTVPLDLNIIGKTITGIQKSIGQVQITGDEVVNIFINSIYVSKTYGKEAIFALYPVSDIEYNLYGDLDYS